MTITLALSQEMQQLLVDAADRHGLSPDAYALRLLESSLAKNQPERIKAMFQSWDEQFDAEEQRATFDELARSIDADRPGERPHFPPEQKGQSW
jgi:endonuclease III-like uncharacterized protein